MQKNINIVYSKDIDALYKKAGEYLLGLLEKYKDNNILFLSSGGSCLKILDYLEITPIGKNLTLTMLDDRFSDDPKINNFLQMQTMDFFKTGSKKKIDIISTVPKPNESISVTTCRIEEQIREWLSKNPNGKVVATVGIGSDGHVAGVMPDTHNILDFSNMFLNDKKLVVGYEAAHETKYRKRVTVTLAFIQKFVDASIFFVIGQDKSGVLLSILTGNEKINVQPASIIRYLRNATLFTDIRLMALK